MLPPLRERREDIPLLARAFLERFRKSMDKPVEGISPEAMRLLESYDWPGNVRELENTMERSVALETEKMISVGVLPDKISHPGRHAEHGSKTETAAHAFPRAESISKGTYRTSKRTTSSRR